MLSMSIMWCAPFCAALLRCADTAESLGARQLFFTAYMPVLAIGAAVGNGAHCAGSFSASAGDDGERGGSGGEGVFAVAGGFWGVVAGGHK